MVSNLFASRFLQEYSTRRILVTEWIDGVKLSDCPPEEIKELIPLAQEVFLTQLLQVCSTCWVSTSARYHNGPLPSIACLFHIKKNTSPRCRSDSSTPIRTQGIS